MKNLPPNFALMCQIPVMQPNSATCRKPVFRAIGDIAPPFARRFAFASFDDARLVGLPITNPEARPEHLLIITPISRRETRSGKGEPNSADLHPTLLRLAS